jgi:predicted permease
MRPADLVRDFRLAIRGLRRNVGFTAVAVLTLALGLGVNTAIFGILDAALLRPLPYPEADRIVTVDILAARPDGGTPDRFPWSYPKYELFRRSASSFSGLAGYSSANLNLLTPEGPVRLEAEEVGGAYFGILGVTPAAGRLFQPGDDATPGEPLAVVLGHGLWQERFGADPAVVGRDVRLNGQALTVVGIAPAGFRGLTGSAEAFVPITLATRFEYAGILNEAGNHWFQVVGRLRPGQSVEQAESEARRAGAIVDRQYRFPEQQGDWTAGVRELAASRVDPGFRRSVILLSGAVGLVLLIACVNLTSLLLVRAVARRREIAVRLALGAGRGHLVRQVLAEALVLALAGGGLGILLARGTVGLLLRLGPDAAGAGLFDPASVSIDGRVLVAALGLTLLAALLVGVIPAVQASRAGMTEPLKSGATVGGERHWTQRGLVVAEVALAVVLLVGAGLLIRSFALLHARDPGFRPEGVLTLRYAAASGDLAQRDPAGFREQLTGRLGAIPGVDAASVGLCAPLTARCATTVVNRVDGRQLGIGSGAPAIGWHMATPDHFRALGIPILRGRAFTPQDRQGAPRVVVLNERAAERLWPGQDPIGRRIGAATAYFAGGDSTAEVVGVVADVRYGGLDDEPMPDLYFPALQARFGGFGTLFVRAGSGRPEALLDAIRREVRALDPNLPLYNVLTMEQRAGAALARPRFAATLLGAFAGIALVLAVVGLYGVLAFAVAQRTREIGLRMALGAGEGRVLRGVLGQGLALAGAGILLGLLGAVALQRIMGGLLYGVAATDPLILGGMALLMALAATAAALLPARRATRVDPMVALRE